MILYATVFTFGNNIEFRLLEPLEIDSVTGKQVIPCSFVSDGASTPRFLWRRFPRVDRFLNYYMLHDYRYAVHNCSRKEADIELRDNLINAGMNRIAAYEVYLGVRLFGKSHW